MVVLYVGLAHAFPPTNTKFKPLLLPTQTGMPYTNTHKHRTSYFKSTLTFMGPSKRWKCLSAARQKRQILAIRHHNQRVRYYSLCRLGTCCSTHNTNFQPLLLLTQAGIPYINIHKHRTSYFKSTLTFMGPAKRRKCLSAARQKRQILAIFNNS